MAAASVSAFSALMTAAVLRLRCESYSSCSRGDGPAGTWLMQDFIRSSFESFGLRFRRSDKCRNSLRRNSRPIRDVSAAPGFRPSERESEGGREALTARACLCFVDCAALNLIRLRTAAYELFDYKLTGSTES